MNFCEIYTSSLSQSTGPWNGSMCSSELEKIHCPKGEIRRCVRLVFGHSEDSLFACCIEKIKELKGTILCLADECIYSKNVSKNKNITNKKTTTTKKTNNKIVFCMCSIFLIVKVTINTVCS